MLNMQNIIENYEGDANDGVQYTILLKMIVLFC